VISYNAVNVSTSIAVYEDNDNFLFARSVFRLRPRLEFGPRKESVCFSD